MFILLFRASNKQTTAFIYVFMAKTTSHDWLRFSILQFLFVTIWLSEKYICMQFCVEIWNNPSFIQSSAGFKFQKIIEISYRKSCFRCAILRCGQDPVTQFTGIDILIE